MALQQSMVLYEKTYDTYIRIKKIATVQTVEEDVKIIQSKIVLYTYASQSYRDQYESDPIEVNVYYFNFDVNAVGNLYEQAYAYIKTLDKYATAIDIINDETP